MKSRMQAIVAASVFTVLSLVFPPLSYFSGAIVSLVTLRNGPGAGLTLAVISAMIVGGLASAAMGNGLYAMIFLVAIWLPVWIISIVLRQTISLALALYTGAGIAIVGITLFHLSVGDVVTFWQPIIQTVFSSVWETLPEAERLTVITGSAQMATAALGATFLLSMTLSLFIARWWQAILYNPGGFGKEFCALRLHRAGAIVTFVIIGVALLTGKVGSLPGDLAVIMVVLFAFPGLTLVHDWITRRNGNIIWLIVLYLLLLFATIQVITVLAIMGIMDTWTDIRKFFVRKNNS